MHLSYVHCIVSMLRYHVVYHSSCICHGHCTPHHHHMNTLHSQHASFNHLASTNISMLIELDIVTFTHQIISMSHSCLIYLRIIILHLHTASITCPTHVLHDIIT